MAYPFLLFAVLALTGFALVKMTKRSENIGIAKTARLPPGPKPKPLVGNVFDIPSVYPWIKLYEWSKIHGPLIRFSIFGQQTYVVSSEKVANDLLRDRGAIYSSRPILPAAGILLAGNKLPVLLPSDPAFPERTAVWRRGRKFTHQIIGLPSVPNYAKTHDLESCRLIRDLISTPTEYEPLFERYAASIVFRLGFGKRVDSGREYYVQESLKLLRIFEHAVMPGNYLVDSFPVLMKLPNFLAPFKRYLLSAQEAHDRFYLELQDLVRKEMNEDRAPPSFTKTFLENQESVGLSDLDGAHLLGALYGAGVGTTAVILTILVLKLLHHPEWQQRLHTEVDEKVGGSRIPGFEDLPRLPTVRAVVKEVLRVSIQGLPHKLIKDDTYEGYFLPAGTTILPNIWAINRDPAVYPDPESFNPDRWLLSKYPTYREPLTKYPNLQHYSAFGFGRRICPGMSLAERSLNIAAARLAWACEISPKLDYNGKELKVPLHDYTSDLISKPKPFQFQLRARDEGRIKVLDRRFEMAKKSDPLNETTSYEIGIEES